MDKPKRYLGDTARHEVHDTLAEHPRCRLDHIAERDCRWYDSLAQARADLPYRDCQWCAGFRT